MRLGSLSQKCFESNTKCGKCDKKDTAALQRPLNREDDLEWPPRALWPCSAERVFLFVVPKRLRAFRNYFFTGRVVTVNCIYNSDLPLTIAAPLVKIAFVALRRARQMRNKNKNSAEDGQSNAEAILNRPLPSCIFGERGVEYSHNQTQGSSCSGLRGSIASFDPFT